MLDNIDYFLLGEDVPCVGVAGIQEASRGLACYLRGSEISKAQGAISSGAIVVLDKSLKNFLNPQGGTVIFVDHPEETLAHICSSFFDYPRKPFDWEHVSSNFPHTTNIHPGATIYPSVTLGEHCLIKAGAVIGAPGFGVFKNSKGKLEHFPQMGGVDIGDNVEIGALSTVASGTFSPTKIGSYTKIDDHVHVAHNVTIGEGTIITAGVKIAGSVVIGSNVWIGVGAVLRDGVEICDNAFIGMGSLVTKSILKEGTYFGAPARLWTS